MITSALIAECRREFDDEPKSNRRVRDGDGSSTVFNVGDKPIIENSYSIYKGTSAQSEGADYTIDLDNGDIQFTTAPASGVEVKIEYKHAYWRDKNWNEAINSGIEKLNAKGFFRQIVRTTGIVRLSADVQRYSGPSACIDMYEILKPTNNNLSGTYTRLPYNWSYQQDANVFAVGTKPSAASPLAISYLRRMQKYGATSATLDVKDDWIDLLKKRAGSNFYRFVAGKIAKQGNATVEEGHFSFTNARTMANDLLAEFNDESTKAKPTRPAKDVQYHIPSSGPAG